MAPCRLSPESKATRNTKAINAWVVNRSWGSGNYFLRTVQRTPISDLPPHHSCSKLTHPAGSLELLEDLDLSFLPRKMAAPRPEAPSFLGNPCLGPRWFLMRSRLPLPLPFLPAQADPQANSWIEWVGGVAQGSQGSTAQCKLCQKGHPDASD